MQFKCIYKGIFNSSIILDGYDIIRFFFCISQRLVYLYGDSHIMMTTFVRWNSCGMAISGQLWKSFNF